MFHNIFLHKTVKNVEENKKLTDFQFLMPKK